MLLSTKYGWIKWLPVALSVAFAAIVLGNDLEFGELDNHLFAASLAAFAGFAVFTSMIAWIFCKTTLSCPKCGRWVGSRYEVRICRHCGCRL